MMGNKLFLEADFWKQEGKIITNNLKEIKENLLPLDDFDVILERLWKLIHEELIIQTNMAKDLDSKLYYMHELEFLEKKLCRIKVDTFYNNYVQDRIVYTEEGIDEKAWEDCYSFIVGRFDGTYKYISF